MLRRTLALALAVLAFGAACAAFAGLAPVALADPPTVRVEVRANAGTVDGTVTLTAGGRSFTCHTHGGSCAITGVPGGPAQASFAPDGGGAAPPPRTVMIAPSGDTQLVLSAGR